MSKSIINGNTIFKEKHFVYQLKYMMCISAIIFFVTHGYCFLNALYSHDSLMIFQNDAGWQISLGRFLQPAYCRVRGMIAAPLWIGLLTYIYLSFSICIIKKLLSSVVKEQNILLIGMLTTSITLTLSNATYIPWSDIYMLALLLSVLGAYIAIKHSSYFIFSMIFLSLSMGLYQAYIQVAVILLMLDVFFDVLQNKDVRNILKKKAFYLCVVIASFVLYYCLFKLFLYAYQIPATVGYNGLTKVGHYKDIWNIFSCFTGSYAYLWRFFTNPISVHKRLSVIANFTLLVIGIVSICVILSKNKLSKFNIIFTIVLVCLFPFGVNFIYFITQGMEHGLMIYSFSVAPLVILPLINYVKDLNCSNLFKVLRIVVLASFVAIIFNGIIFANQVYVKKDLEARSTISIVTRIIDRIEQTEGYVAGETPVKFIGKIGENPQLVSKRAGFCYDGPGNSAIEATTYAIYSYINGYLSYPINQFWGDAPPFIANELDAFPSKNCTILVDGVLYLKLSGKKEVVNYNVGVPALPDYPIIDAELSFCIDSEVVSDFASYIRGWAYHDNDICRVLVGSDNEFWETFVEARPDVQKVHCLDNDKQGFVATILTKLDGYSLYLINEEKKEIYTVKVVEKENDSGNSNSQ